MATPIPHPSPTQLVSWYKEKSQHGFASIQHALEGISFLIYVSGVLHIDATSPQTLLEDDSIDQPYYISRGTKLNNSGSPMSIASV